MVISGTSPVWNLRKLSKLLHLWGDVIKQINANATKFKVGILLCAVSEEDVTEVPAEDGNETRGQRSPW